MHKLLGHILDWFGGRYYVVEYDAGEAEDLGMPLPVTHGRFLLCCVDSREYGANMHGVFKSRLAAERYLQSWDDDRGWCPLRPQHITRIPRNHPLVKQSIWR